MIFTTHCLATRVPVSAAPPRRVQPRLSSSVAAVRGVGQRVVPALVETAIGLGNAGVTAVTQLGRAVPPVVEESAAHMHHMVSEHIAPAAKASMQVKYYEEHSLLIAHTSL